jgi:uncharacterized protein (TIGR02117 family)
MMNSASAGLCLFLVACASAIPPPSPPQPTYPTALNAEPIWVFKAGWHTGLILDHRALQGKLAILRAMFPNAEYLIFGWGNRAFYMAPDPASGTALAALFPSKSTILVQPCEASLPACLPKPFRLDELTVPATGMVRIDAYIASSFETDEAGEPLLLGPGPGMDGAFFASGRTYDAFDTCNTWTAQALHQGGLRISSRGVIFASQMWSQIGGVMNGQNGMTSSR